MRQCSERLSRSAEKEASWRGHVSRQAAGRVSIRAYCQEHGLSQPSFYAWRREIAKRDAEREGPRRLLQASPTSRAASRRRPPEVDSTATPQRSTDGCVTRSGGAGLVAVEIVGDATPRWVASPTLEIECPGGPLIRLREDVPAEVLQRVMAVCQQVRPAQAALATRQVRSC